MVWVELRVLCKLWLISLKSAGVGSVRKLYAHTLYCIGGNVRNQGFNFIISGDSIADQDTPFAAELMTAEPAA